MILPNIRIGDLMSRSQCDPYIRLFEKEVKRKVEMRKWRGDGRAPSGLQTFHARIVLYGPMRFEAQLTGLRSIHAVAVALVLLFAASGCGRRASIPTARAPKPVRVPKNGETQKGIASWYGHPYHGRRAANGEVYDMNQLTAAHREWPFELMVRVTNLKNDRSVDVRITDRGPFVDGRIIDLSRAAAEQLEMIGPGIVPVKITSLGFARGDYAVQLGAFKDREKAEAFRRRMEQEHGSATLTPERPGPAPFAVWYRRTDSMDEARKLVAQLKKKGVTAVVVTNR